MKKIFSFILFSILTCGLSAQPYPFQDPKLSDDERLEKGQVKLMLGAASDDIRLTGGLNAK